MGSVSQASSSSDHTTPPKMQSSMTMVVLTMLLVGFIAAKPKYALIETEDSPNEAIGVDARLDEPGEPTGNKIEPAKGSDYCFLDGLEGIVCPPPGSGLVG